MEEQPLCALLGHEENIHTCKHRHLTRTSATWSAIAALGTVVPIAVLWAAHRASVRRAQGAQNVWPHARESRGSSMSRWQSGQHSDALGLSISSDSSAAILNQEKMAE